jgi:signal transduction histidine kinase
LFSRPDSAYYYGQLMYDHAARTGQKVWMAWALRGQGVALLVQGQRAKAIDYYQRSLELSQEAHDLIGVAGSLNNIGLLYFDQGDLAKSLEYHLRSLDMRERCGDWKGEGASLMSIGHIHERRGVYDLALDHYTRSLEISEKKRYGTGIGIANMSIASVALRHRDVEQALGRYAYALTLFEESNDQLNQSKCLTGQGTAYLQQGRPDLAISSCARAEALVKALGELTLQKEACDCLFKANKALGRRDQALRFIEQVRQIGDSIDAQEVSKSLMRMEFVQELRTDSIAQAELQQRMDLANQAAMARETNRKNIFFFLGIAILIVAGGLWSRLRYMRRAKEEADELRGRAERSERIKQQFLANMSHEIRTPMNAIMGMTGILQRTPHPPEQDRYLNAIKQSSDNLLVVLNDILDLSKIEAGRTEMQLIPFDVRQVITNTRDILQFKAEEKELSLELDLAADIPVLLEGDPARLQQILLNLAGNAIKFTETGGVTIRARVSGVTPGSTTLHVAVIDTGIGIPVEKQSLIFDEFTQAYSDTSRKYGGTGLGLSISKHLAEMQGGRIHVSSEEGKGSTFSISIPYAIPLTEAPTTVSTTSAPVELRDLRILLAEDNEFNVMVALDELGDAIPGVHVDVAANGRIAVENAAMHRYDLVLMDVQMPEMNGYDATKAILALPGAHGKVPIIAMTANVMKAELDLCKAAGMVGHIPKPFTRLELLSAIRAALAS